MCCVYELQQVDQSFPPHNVAVIKLDQVKSIHILGLPSYMKIKNYKCVLTVLESLTYEG